MFPFDRFSFISNFPVLRYVLILETMLIEKLNIVLKQCCHKSSLIQIETVLIRTKFWKFLRIYGNIIW